MTEPMGGYVEYRKTPSGWRWRRVSENNKVVASGQGYSRRIDLIESCEGQYPGIPVIPANAPWDDETDAA